MKFLTHRPHSQNTTSTSLVSQPIFSTTNNQKNLSESLLGLGVVGFSGIILLTLLFKWLIRICRPNEILVVTGSRFTNPTGVSQGYRVVFGGWTLVKPILETARRMDVALLPVLVEVNNAYAKGGTPLNIQAIANVKVSTDPNVVGNAIERFLGRDRKEMIQVAQENLEGNLRSVVAQLTPEQVNEDRLRFAEQIAVDVKEDLQRLGLQLDTLKIQSVFDDVDYLKSISRRRIALIIRDAEIAESEAIGQAERSEAEMEQIATVSKTQAETIILEKQNEVRTKIAILEKDARSEEQRTEASALEVRAKSEQELQLVRAQLERLRLRAEEVLPAQAQQKALQLQARGQASATAENAKASAYVNNMLTQVWHEAGDEAEIVFLLQQIELVLNQASALPNQLHLKHISAIDGNDSNSLAGLMTLYPNIVKNFLIQIHETLGIDVIGTLNPSNSDS